MTQPHVVGTTSQPKIRVFSVVYFYGLRDNGLLDILNEALVGASHVLSGREATPTAGIRDGPTFSTGLQSC